MGIVDDNDKEILIYAPSNMNTGDIAWRIDQTPVNWLEE